MTYLSFTTNVKGIKKMFITNGLSKIEKTYKLNGLK